MDCVHVHVREPVALRASNVPCSFPRAYFNLLCVKFPLPLYIQPIFLSLPLSVSLSLSLSLSLRSIVRRRRRGQRQREMGKLPGRLFFPGALLIGHVCRPPWHAQKRLTELSRFGVLGTRVLPWAWGVRSQDGAPRTYKGGRRTTWEFPGHETLTTNMSCAGFWASV
jgi:hypothetical protein